MAAEADVFLRARGRTLTAFRQGTRRGAPAERNLGRALRVPPGSLPRRAGGAYGGGPGGEARGFPRGQRRRREAVQKG